MGFRGIVDDGGNTRGKVMVPTGFASSAHEMTLLNVPESAAARNFNLVHYTQLLRGGHFAFWEQPEAMVRDVRQFSRN